MEDIRRSFRVLLDVAFLWGLGVGLSFLIVLPLDFLFGTQAYEFLTEEWQGFMLLNSFGLFALSFAIQDGHFRNYRKKYERHNEG